MDNIQKIGKLYDAKYDKFGSYCHFISDHDDYFSVTWEDDLYFNELIEPYDFYKLIHTQEIIIIEDDSEKNRLFLRIKHGR